MEVEPSSDDRGFFARVFDADTFDTAGLDARVAQCSISFNRRRGTVRGLHLQRPPFGETKLVRCIAGAIFDVVVDLRSTSASFEQWFATDLTADNRRGLVVAPGVAHGFCTLADATEVAYQMSVPYRQEAAVGVRWDDPDLRIPWPDEAPTVISVEDEHLPLLSELDLPALGL